MQAFVIMNTQKDCMKNSGNYYLDEEGLSVFDALFNTHLVISENRPD